MNSFRMFGRQAKALLAESSLLLAAVSFAFVPALVSAATLTERYIDLSSSSASAQNVTYGVNFTSIGAAGAFVVDFCSDSPIIEQACTAPTGLSATGVSTTTSGFTATALDANTIVVAGTVAAASTVSVDLDGITNPSSSGAIYARIVTYDTSANANQYDSEDLGTGNVDEGSAAISITDTIGVSGAVLESMVFCVSGSAISADCADVTSPVVELGETVGNNTALISTAVSEGSVYTQISTNAASGAVVSLKSSAEGCGGLVRSGDPSSCDIAPALNTGVVAGTAAFGVKTTTATGTDGVLQPVDGSGYGTLAFALNYTEGDTAGVTSTYGDPFLDTDGAPANNMNMELVFGASVSNLTPGGTYSADLSLIATGKF